MTKSNHCGCFRWFASLKKSINKRCARARNALICGVRKDNPHLKTQDPVNDTGTPDIVFSKKPVSPKHGTEAGEAGSWVLVDCEDGDQPERSASMTSSVISDIAETLVKHSLTKIVSECEMAAKVVDDTKPTKSASLTSSVISDIAEAAVRSSLTGIVAESETSSKVIDDTKPERTASMTSSVISDIAETAVLTSLTDIAGDSNQSARLQGLRKVKSEIQDAKDSNVVRKTAYSRYFRN